MPPLNEEETGSPNARASKKHLSSNAQASKKQKHKKHLSSNAQASKELSVWEDELWSDFPYPFDAHNHELCIESDECFFPDKSFDRLLRLVVPSLAFKEQQSPPRKDGPIRFLSSPELSPPRACRSQVISDDEDWKLDEPSESEYIHWELEFSSP